MAKIKKQSRKQIVKILDHILHLIKQDVTIISNNVEGQQLDARTAQTLSRYATTLANIKDEKEEEVVVEKKNLDKKSTDELIRMWHKGKDKK